VSPSKQRRVPAALATSMMFSSESCSVTFPSRSLQISFPSVKSWKNHRKRKEVGCLPQDCTKQCNNCVPILTFFFLRAFLPLVNVHCGGVSLDLPEIFFVMLWLMQRNVVAFHLSAVCLNLGVPGCADMMCKKIKNKKKLSVSSTCAPT